MLNSGQLGGVKVRRQWRVDHDGLHRLIETYSVDYQPATRDVVKDRL